LIQITEDLERYESLLLELAQWHGQQASWLKPCDMSLRLSKEAEKIKKRRAGE